MRIKKLKKLIAIAATCTIISTISPLTASAEWLQDSHNNWNWTENGIKATGWRQIQGIWYYFDDNGNMKTGWIQTSDSKWYYINSNGSMKIGWIYDSDGKWYNLAPSGEMRTGWIQETDGKSYFASLDGAMQIGVIKVEEKAYAFGENGALLKEKSISFQGKEYKTDDKGVVIGENSSSEFKSFTKDGGILSPKHNETNTEENKPKIDSITPSSSPSSRKRKSSKHSSSSNLAITSIETVNDINVEIGTELEAVGLPNSVNIILSDNTTTSAAVTWDIGTPAYDKTIAGTYTFAGTIKLPTGVQNPNNTIASVQVNVKEDKVKEKTISSVEQLNDIDVYKGTELSSAGLSSSVNVKLNDNTTTSAAVVWDVGTPVYDKTIAGTYTFAGTITLPTGVKNPNNLKASVKVNVEEKTISSVEQLNDIDVSIGTELDQAGLASSVNVKLNDNTTTSAAVVWDAGTPVYDKAIAGTYTIAGTIELPTGVKNPSNVTATTLVIVGNKNRAFNKATTASGYTGLSEGPSKAVDNNLTSTKWCSTNLGDKWLVVDLGKSYQIGRWYVRHARDLEGNPSYNTKNFELQKSDNGQDWKDVDSVINNTSDVTDRNVSLFRARYVRLYITQATQDGGNNAARIYEFEVYKDAL